MISPKHVNAVKQEAVVNKNGADADPDLPDLAPVMQTRIEDIRT